MSSSLRTVAVLAFIAAVPFIAGCAVSTQEAACLARLGLITDEDVIYATDEFVVLAVWEGPPDNCPTNFSWFGTGPIELSGTSGSSITARALGSGAATLRVQAGADFEASQTFDFLRNTSDINLSFSGLPTGLGGRLDLRGPGGFDQTLTGATLLQDVAAGDWEYDVREVTGGPISHRFGGVDLSGGFTLGRNQSFGLSIPYEQLTGQLDLTSNLPDGFTGAIGEVHNAATVSVSTTPLSLALEPGLHTWNAFSIDPSGYDFQPSVTSGSFDVAAGATIKLDWQFSATRGLFEAELTGLPENATVPSVLSGPEDRTPTLPGMWYVQPGEYSLEVPAVDVANQETDRTETYRTTPSTRTFDILAGLPFRLTIAFLLVSWLALFYASTGVLADPWGHAAFILLASQLVLTVVWNRANPPGVAADGAAAAVESGTITISGPAPWVTVTGPIDEDGDFVATGSGTVAGFPDVPVTFTGTLTEEGVISGTLQMGSDTPPTGLPNGAITYTISANRAELGAIGIPPEPTDP